MKLLNDFFNLIFYPVVQYLPPRWSLIAVSFIVTLLTTLAYKYLTNQNVIKALKEEVKQIQQELKLNRENKEKFAELNKRMMLKNLELTKHSMKPTLITFLPLILLLSWMSATYRPAGDLFSWGFSLPLFGTGIGWLWTYILSSLIFNLLLRKALKVH